jgi:hypothetical protein
MLKKTFSGSHISDPGQRAKKAPDPGSGSATLLERPGNRYIKFVTLPGADFENER